MAKQSWSGKEKWKGIGASNKPADIQTKEERRKVAGDSLGGGGGVK